MKVVISACYGGFGVSHEGMLLYAKKKGITLYPEATTFGHNYWTKPESERPTELPGAWMSHSEDVRKAHNKAYSEAQITPRDIARDDPDLIAIVEELGDRASGAHAELKVVEIPDGVEYEIEEYDGFEHVAEKHRTWN